MALLYTAERAENRLGIKTTALLIGRHGKLGVEKAITENVSTRGVRVISTSEWDMHDTILVALPKAHFTSAARVTYCDPIGNGLFGTGLEFVGKDEQLEINALAAASQP